MRAIGTMTRQSKARTIHGARMAACVALLALLPCGAWAGTRGGPRSGAGGGFRGMQSQRQTAPARPAQRAQAQRPQQGRPAAQRNGQAQRMGPQGFPHRGAGAGQNARQVYRPGYTAYGGQSAGAANGFANGTPRPAYGNGGYGNPPYSMRATPMPNGHLPDWMAQHSNLSADQQERLLRQEPGFNRLSTDAQQRAVEQLHRLDQLPAAQRERRLERSEALERLSPGERMQVADSARQLSILQPDRQTMVRRAWRELRGVPIDQRATVLGSARYQQSFSPDERNILTNLLRVEPYEPPQR